MKSAIFRALRLFVGIRLITAVLFSLLIPHCHHVSLVALRDVILSFFFLRCGLRPRSVHLYGGENGDISTTVMHVWVPAKRRRKPVLVLVHGFGGNAKWQWVRQIRSLSRSFDLFVPDLVFFGRSVTDGHDRSIQFQARCVGETMRRLGVGSYTVCGISYGGYVAYRMAAKEAVAEVERLILMTAGVGASAAQLNELAGHEGRDVADILLPRSPEDLTALMRRSMYRPPSWMPKFLLRDFIQVMYINHRNERVELLKKLLQNGVDLDPLPVLTQETLILWGDHDTVFPLHLGHQLQRHLEGKAKLEIINDAGHALQLEQPGQVNRSIIRFLLCVDR